MVCQVPGRVGHMKASSIGTLPTWKSRAQMDGLRKLRDGWPQGHRATGLQRDSESGGHRPKNVVIAAREHPYATFKTLARHAVKTAARGLCMQGVAHPMLFLKRPHNRGKRCTKEEANTQELISCGTSLVS